MAKETSARTAQVSCLNRVISNNLLTLLRYTRVLELTLRLLLLYGFAFMNDRHLAKGYLTKPEGTAYLKAVTAVSTFFTFATQP